jgi:hypothetical protein
MWKWFDLNSPSTPAASLEIGSGRAAVSMLAERPMSLTVIRISRRRMGARA